MSSEQQKQANTSINYRVMRRNGKTTPFDKEKIKLAMSKSFLAVEGDSASASRRIHEVVDKLTEQVSYALMRSRPSGGTFHIEDIQDQVELSLMRAGEHKIARAYVIYREEHARKRAANEAEIQSSVPESEEIAPTEIITALQESQLSVLLSNGSRKALDVARLQTIITEACQNLAEVDQELILKEVRRNLYDGVTEKELSSALVMSASMLIEREPNYSQVAARLLMDHMRREALSFLSGHNSEATQSEMAERYPHYFAQYIKRAAELELLDEKLANEYDLERLGYALLPERDNQFTYLGLQTLYDRYFIHHYDTRIELPQAFFMRVAMGLAINEVDRETRAIEFYQLLSSFDFMSSTPTLFNSGTLRPQLSSCYLTTVPDDLYGIFDAIKDDAMLSKFAGGLGNDWTPVRAMGSHIKGTNGKSQGVVPFLKVANDTAVAVNQCFAPDTLLHTGDGIKKIKDVQAGDLVLGQRGHYREVQKRFAYNQTDAMVEIKVKHAISPLHVTSGHPLWALSGLPLGQTNQRSYRQLESGKVSPQWRDAGELKKGDFVAQVIPQEVTPVDGFDDDDARLYGLLLGDGHCSKNGLEWGISPNPNSDAHLDFIRNYLEARGLHYWQSGERENDLQIRWAQNCGLAREATSGQFVRGSASGFTFSREDLYDHHGKKRIARRYAHLPRSQTLSLIQGLIETDGNVSRGKEITFSNTSQALIEGLRYQLLRLGVPSAGQYRERQQNHQGQRADGSTIQFNGLCTSYDLRIPATQEIAERVNCQPLKKQNWLSWNGHIFSRVRSVTPLTAVPFVYDLKVEGDESYMTTSALAHNGGKRKGAMCAYLETWHLDIEDFLELRKNTGDERRRTHDMNSANWIPDLFMKRVSEEAQWTLFSPDDTPDLHDLYGSEFETRYCEYEAKAERGEIKLSKQIPALELWRKMLGMLFETGHPWITFKDPCNIRSPQQHVGVVHSSNLCTEITLNTSADEIAVCNLGSINLPAHIGDDGTLDTAKLQRTITTAMRMLDNVIDYNYYSVPKARRSNLRHRPVGMGLMGFQDALYKMRVPYGSNEAVSFADLSMETISYFAIQASSDLAAERGSYKSYQGSLWDQGILPIDSLQTLADSRGAYLQTDMSQSLDWDSLRQTVKKQGMRNSNTMAIAPTATISNICGVTQSIEPTYQNLFVKSNLSGEFTVINPHLVHDLKQLGSVGSGDGQ
ncbi:MAG: ribonucleoside-diphosphate reductase subunit alpha [Gammaproteobacteria bacterium]|nr:ribonucleoside-diphosphate reductase subunit alpha [Gammaproteobacteria bacterium]